MKLIVGTRGSKLALLQTQIVTKSLLKAYPNLKIEIQPIRTAGDTNPEKPLSEIKAKGIFEKEIDRAVSQGRVDFAVHSMKDIPTIESWGTSVVAVPVRGPPNDVLVSRSMRKIKKLPSRATIG
ncbi:MAG: hydroxymethylbilane synthase, partial [Candidatus Bathyarchaeia archaeon]